VAPSPEDRQTIAQRVSAGFRPQKNIQPQQGRQNPDVELELSIARDGPTARLFSTDTEAGHCPVHGPCYPTCMLRAKPRSNCGWIYNNGSDGNHVSSSLRLCAPAGNLPLP